ncbi:hypothetical protein BDV23DRAFT_171419 [Aspergillus alliaceus]|uniref:Uncharacterized protein n=1 Tax=Petromyces alliaceus TaxID=209559 RepID=A0A5N7CDQ0_PETAA|nr:uncharacterized protein BDW43DRAFT_301657 [Aspergillus alliaceus]KAB8231428.1 hypothetical protein BDW43DRAFT_301657 [Aspergillus alliaceus]KAE8391858.1 hypothetical protein BDV23DRAFT_171419 [Aspergillus alliaceus]
MTIQAPDQLPWDPNCTQFPSRKELPKIPGAPDGAAWVWGKDDEIGRLNLLTPARVKAAAAEIQTGEMIRLDLPLHIPEHPAFGREPFEHKIKTVLKDIVYDDTYSLNPQSGTQWDGFRHFAHIDTKQFYNGTTSTDIEQPTPTSRCSIHHWATHGIAARALLLDYHHYAQTTNTPYDPYTSHPITLAALTACAKSQGIDLRPASQGGDIQIGDILLIRSGFVTRYNELSSEQRAAAAARSHEDVSWAGVSQDQDMVDWLHDCYFAAVAGDSPTFECWPPVPGTGYLHESILALWGMPLGEMWDLERIAARCREIGRWRFFVSSAPANVVGGVGSHANAFAIM